MTIDDLFTPEETRTPDVISGNTATTQGAYDRLWETDYADWIVRNVNSGFTVSLDLLFKKRTPCPDITEDPSMYRWISDRIAGAIDAESIIRSTVCFDIENFRTHKSLNARVFVCLPESAALFIRTLYRLFLIGGYVCHRLEAFIKIDGAVYHSRQDGDTCLVTPKKVFLDRSVELCKYMQWIEHYDSHKYKFNEVKHYQNYFGVQMDVATYNNLVYNYTNSQPSCVDRFVTDILRLYDTANTELGLLQQAPDVSHITDTLLTRRFLDNRMAMMRWVKRFFARAARNHHRCVTGEFWSLCKKEMRRQCCVIIWDYFKKVGQ